MECAKISRYLLMYVIVFLVSVLHCKSNSTISDLNGSLQTHLDIFNSFNSVLGIKNQMRDHRHGDHSQILIDSCTTFRMVGCSLMALSAQFRSYLAFKVELYY